MAYRGAVRTSDWTGVRLAAALLGYFVLVTTVITLSPFDFAVRRVRMSWVLSPADMIANVALFVPIGFLLRSLHRVGDRHDRRAIVLAAAISLAIETAQIFLRGRHVSPIDLCTNTAGAWLGVMVRDYVARWASWHPRVVSQSGLDIPLVGLLYLLMPQLWLSGAGLVQDARRSVTTLLLGCAGSVVLVALHRHRWQSGLRLTAWVVPPLALVWFLVGALPALAVAPRLYGSLGGAVVVFTWWLTAGNAPSHARRFELDTLRRFVPMFTLYLVTTALWPPARTLTAWHGALGFIDRLNNAGVLNLLVVLEQVGAFTLLGYALAEWRGRRELSLVDDLPGIVLASLALAGLLEGAQGVLTGPGASLLRALLSVSGAAYGVAVYHLARAHVRALRAALPGEPSQSAIDVARAA